MQPPIPKTGILIATENLEQLQLAIDAAEGRATQRCVPATYLAGLADHAEIRCEELLVMKTERPGATLTFTAEGPGKSYRHSAQGTEVKMLRRGKGWYLISVERVPVYAGNNEKRKLLLTAAQKAAALERFEKKLAAA